MKDPTMLETKPTSAGQGPGFLRETDSHEPYLAACHKLSERLTATTNYLTAALSLCETEPVAGATLPGYTEMLKKALGQISRANEELRHLRILLMGGPGQAGPREC